ncbi:MAG: gas vesicle protein GvpJ [Solirubrobacteraceae bacterium]
MVSAPRTLYGSAASRSRPVTLVDLIDRVLAGGVVVQGHVTLAVADVDLIDLDIALLVAATATVAAR